MEVYTVQAHALETADFVQFPAKRDGQQRYMTRESAWNVVRWLMQRPAAYRTIAVKRAGGTVFVLFYDTVRGDYVDRQTGKRYPRPAQMEKAS